MFCLLALLLSPSSLTAQYFGQNKVRYESLDFKVLKTDHFDIHYYDEEEPAIRELGRMAERWYLRLSSVLDHQLLQRQPVVMYASHPAFRGTAVIPDFIGETTGGVTEGLRNRMVLPFAGPLQETDHVLGHEMVHAFQFDMTRIGDLPGAAVLPLWFIEGMAEYLSVGPVDSSTAMWMRDAVRRNELPDIEHLDDPDYFPYRYGQAFWAYVGGRYGDEVIGRMLRSAAESGSAETAIRGVLRTDPKVLSEEWHAALRNEYEPVLRASTPAEEYGTLLVGARKRGGEINVSPSLSPDASHVVFYSERDLFSIDLYLADANTGQIQDKITESALDPHIDSLHFVNSAGDWSRDGTLFAFGSIHNGRPEVSFYELQRKKVVRRIRLPQLGEVYNLTWSPDGQALALSAMVGGVTDLFVLDLKTEDLRQLTRDAFTDLHPSWSPDGTKIAFSTDRFNSDLQTLAFGQYRLALLDPTSGQIERAPGFDQGKHLNPQWSADSRSIYFLSDRDGIPNIYRASLVNGMVYRVTNLQTGVSGITELSPALSVASKADTIAFSAFSDGTYSIRRLEGPATVAGTAVDGQVPANAGILPPRTAATGNVATLLRDAQRGLRSGQDFTTAKYSPSLSLDYIAPPSISVGASNYGSLVAGGTTLAWSDLLGGHNLFTTLQTTTSTEGGNFLNNLAAMMGYQNSEGRWTWGFSGGQVPLISGDFSQTLGVVGGRPVVEDESVTFWQINREILGYVAYPFNRAQRLEFSGGYRHISFDAEERRQVYDVNTGQLIVDDVNDIDAGAPLNLGTAAMALVYDTSIFGGTSPVNGRRYRFEAGGNVGSLGFGTFLADYRQYFSIRRKVSLAGRLLHFGRYGGSSEDSRLQPLFVGYDSLIRGYDPGSFSASECGPTLQQSGACPVFDQLLGSRMAVANAEVRVPIFGVLGVIPSPGVPPVETALFYDAGVAWTTSDKANFLGGSRRPVTSYGSSLRINLLGFAIAQISLVHPNDRPDRNWLWEFSFLPGF
jgi:Tol biopolymer transport system component